MMVSSASLQVSLWGQSVCRRPHSGLLCSQEASLLQRALCREGGDLEFSRLSVSWVNKFISGWTCGSVPRGRSKANLSIGFIKNKAMF